MAPRTLHKLSPGKAQTINVPGRHGDGGGLYLHVDKEGRRRWVFLYRWRGKLTELGLGAAAGVIAGKRRDGATLAEARAKADRYRAMIREGLNPKEEKQKEKREAAPIPTFGQAADELVAELTKGFKNEKHREQWVMTMRDYCKPIRAIRVDEVETEDVLRCLRPLWTTRPETARRLRGRIERVLDAQRALGNRAGDNPARWEGHLEALLGEQVVVVKHHKALPIDDMPGFVKRLRGLPGTSARAFEFAILCASRSGEVREMTWAEVDFDARMWTVPIERMKDWRTRKAPHRVPLTDRAVEILRAQLPAGGVPRPGAFVFPGQRPGKPLSVMAFEMLFRRCKIDATPHGCRSAFRDWAAERTGFSGEVVEMALAHTITNKVEAAYRRGDLMEKRAKLMAAWAEFLDARQGKVVSLQRVEARA